MVVLVLSIVNIGPPSVEEDLGFSGKCLQWVVSGYALTFGVILLLAGRAVALFGRRRDECEEAASKREDSQEISAYLAECPQASRL